jgi:Leucine-rich repeat (LRR) protein
MKWTYNDLKKWIENGCDKLVGESANILDINYNNLTTLQSEIGNLINLREFGCHSNKLTTSPKIYNHNIQGITESIQYIMSNKPNF